MTAWRRALVAAAWSVLLAAAPAQVTLTHQDAQGVPVCTLRAWASGGCDGGLGLGFVTVDLQNVDGRPHTVAVSVASVPWGSADVRTLRSAVLQPGEQRRLFQPLTVPPTHALLTLEVDGVGREVQLDCSRGGGVVALLLTDRPELGPASLEAVQALPSRWSKRTPDQVVVAGDHVPADWRMFTAFTAVVVDGGGALDADRQQALCRYAAAGGTVVVAGADRLASGALRELAARDIGAIGFGQVIAIPAFGGDTTAMRARLARAATVGQGLPVATSLLQEQTIGGLGETPVTAFVLVILLFAILVGPVNFIVLRRRRQPMLALLTVPLLGFGTTALILTYGVFHDGFGVRGVVTSFTALDQPRRECSAFAARTLFAGLAPDELTMGEQAVLLSPRASYGGGHSGDRWSWNGDRERLDGAVLPSRTPTPLLTVQQGTARQRLTLRRVGEDRLEVLAGGGVEPRGELVLRDLDGRWWRGTDGQLSPVADAVGAALLQNACARLELIGRHADQGHGPDPRGVPLPGYLGAPGSYLTAVAAAPWLDEHGLSVDYDVARHYVAGRLHEEDFVR
ncbi:MAG: hypothetical protein H6835_02080 [Planctomycetes bacterium]|nr:hypothetical protein [Planctomycetota bacterium]